MGVGERVVAYDDLGVKVVKNVLVPMEDGVRLAADVYLPLDGELDGPRAYPLVLEYIPHRTSIIPIDFTDDRYRDDCHYKGGLMRKYYDPGAYGNMMVAFNAMPPDPDAAGGAWAEVWEQHLARNEPYVLRWLRHQKDGPYWRNGSVADVAGRIRCPVFMIGGWRDGYTNPPFRLWEALDVPRRLLMGPWNHAVPDVAIPGPRIDYLPEVVAWLDHWCKGGAAPAGAPVAVYMQRYDRPDADRLDTPGEWRGEPDWPVPGASEGTQHLPAGGALPASAGEARARRLVPSRCQGDAERDAALVADRAGAAAARRARRPRGADRRDRVDVHAR